MISFRLAVVALGVVMIRNAWADYYVDPISVPLNIRGAAPVASQAMEHNLTATRIVVPR